MSTPAITAPTRRPLAGRHTFLFLAGYYLLAVVYGVRGVYAARPTLLDLILPLGLACVLIVWALTDARRRGHRIPLLARSWFALGYFVTVPGYVVWSRGWRGVLWLLLHVTLWFVVAFGTMFAGAVAVFFLR